MPRNLTVELRATVTQGKALCVAPAPTLKKVLGHDTQTLGIMAAQLPPHYGAAA
jgi:hypothetical protein